MLCDAVCSSESDTVMCSMREPCLLGEAYLPDSTTTSTVLAKLCADTSWLQEV